MGGIYKNSIEKDFSCWNLGGIYKDSIKNIFHAEIWREFAMILSKKTYSGEIWGNSQRLFQFFKILWTQIVFLVGAFSRGEHFLGGSIFTRRGEHFLGGSIFLGGAFSRGEHFHGSMIINEAVQRNKIKSKFQKDCKKSYYNHLRPKASFAYM